MKLKFHTLEYRTAIDCTIVKKKKKREEKTNQ